jgi:tetratricopeptide (TPR) repeat protein
MADEDSARATPFPGADSALLAATLGTVSDNPRVDALLERQIVLADLQIDALRKLDDFELSHLRWRRFSDQMSGAAQMMLVVVGLVILIGLGAAVWDAAHDGGLVVEGFSVPPDLAAKGLTGEVIASKVLDRLATFQAQTTSMRASASYANNWGDDIKVQIPNTGVSIGEFNRALHQWLGHATHISGEVWRTPDGVALAARVGGTSTPVARGPEADIDKLVQSAAEQIYRATQPYRYASWLDEHGRAAESNAVLQSIVDGNDARERAWAYNGMAHNTIITGDVAAAQVFTIKASEADPALLLPRFNRAGGAQYLGHDEESLAVLRDILAREAKGDSTMQPEAVAGSLADAHLEIALLTGDYADALERTRTGVTALGTETLQEIAVAACAFLHDAGCVRGATAAFEPTEDSSTLMGRTDAQQAAHAALGQWDAVAKAAPGFHAVLLRSPFMRGVYMTDDLPLWALAVAHLGDVRQARVLIAATPLDCSPCLRARAKIEALGHNWDAAETWFARAVHDAPSIPFAYKEWGEMLLAKGDLAGAVAEFADAHTRGSHYADPLELWAEALIRANRSDLALATFDEASKYAPNWGRLHLKWGEALRWSGDRAGAARQFAMASPLYLVPAERAELERVRHG